MIYLIITTCIINRYGIINNDIRKDRYLYSITTTLKYLPTNITPIIVENNGTRETYLDHFTHNDKAVTVIYTDNNKKVFKNKAVNELLDIKDVIHELEMNDTDIIIKLTGRYCALSPLFFQTVIDHQNSYDAFIKYYNVSTSSFEQYDSVLGCYAIRCNYIKLWNSISLDTNISPEINFARFSRSTIMRIKEIDTLDVECSFADNHTVMCV